MDQQHKEVASPERIYQMSTISRINFYNPKNVNEWEAHKVNPIQVFYTHKDFHGKILLVKRGIEESELFFINSAEDIIGSFFVNQNYEDLADTLESIFVNGFDKTLENIS